MAAAKALCRTLIGALRPVTPAVDPQVQIHNLDDYDTALGLFDSVDGDVLELQASSDGTVG